MDTFNSHKKAFFCCGEARFDSESVLMAVSDDPHIIKTLSSSGELYFEILFGECFDMLTVLCVQLNV